MLLLSKQAQEKKCQEKTSSKVANPEKKPAKVAAITAEELYVYEASIAEIGY